MDTPETERQNIFALFEKNPHEAAIKLIRCDLTIALVQKLRMDTRPTYVIARSLKIKTAVLKRIMQGSTPEDMSIDDLLRLCSRAGMGLHVSLGAPTTKQLVDFNLRVRHTQ